MRAITVVATALVCAWLFLSAPAHADGLADEADLQFSLGAEAYTKGDFKNALQHFLASNRLVQNRNVMFNIARAYEQLDRFPDAYRWYVDAGRGAADPKLADDVKAALARLAPKVAVIQVETTPPGATVFIDRKDLGSVGTSPAQLGLKDGTYTVIVELAGYESTTVGDVQVSAGQNRQLTLELKRILGRVEISGPVGTKVRIDDEASAVACSLPCSVDLPPGPHIAYFERSGFTVAPQQFTVVAKQTVKTAASSIAVVGSLVVSADETNALIEVDGKPVGFTPAVLANIPIGKRRVRVSLRGYVPLERDVEIRANAQTDLRDLVLTPERSISAASREKENIEDAPASVTVISSQELEAFAYPTIMEAVRGVRGLAVNYDSTYGNASVRGLGQANDFSNRLLVLSDGAVLNENILYQPFIHYDGRVDLGDVERIEVVRGPSSALYGTGAVSGVINLVLRDRDEPNGVHASVSSYDNATSRARVGAMQRFDHGGVWASAATAVSQGRTERLLIDPGDGTGAALQSTEGFDKFHAYTLTSKAWYDNLSVQAFWTARKMTVPTGNYGSRFADTRSSSQDRRGLLEIKYKSKIGSSSELVLRAHGDYAFYNLDYRYDVDPENPGPGTQNTYRYIERYRAWWGGAEARLTMSLAKTAKLTIGTEASFNPIARMVGGSYDVDNTSFDRTLNTSTPYRVFAGSALLDWRPTPRVRVQGGLRFDYWDITGDENLSGDMGGTTFPAASPRLAVITKPTSRDVLKVMAGSAFRAPSAYEFFYNDGGFTQVSSDACGTKLKPERVYSVEVEGTHRFNIDWVGLAAVHGTLAQNIVETVPVGDTCGATIGADPTASYYKNSDVDQRIVGVDLELRREFRGGFMAALQYGGLYGRYARSPDPSLDLPADRRLPNAPTNFAGAKVIVPIVPTSLSAAFRAALEDRRRLDTTLTERSERAVVADAVLSGRITRHHLRYAAGVYNLLNWRYSLPAAPYASPLMPQNGRSFMFSVTLER